MGDESGGVHGVATDVAIRSRLKRVDDDVRYVRRTVRAECLTDRERRAAVGESDFDDSVRVVGDE